MLSCSLVLIPSIFLLVIIHYVYKDKLTIGINTAMIILFSLGTIYSCLSSGMTDPGIYERNYVRNIYKRILKNQKYLA